MEKNYAPIWELEKRKQGNLSEVRTDSVYKLEIGGMPIKTSWINGLTKWLYRLKTGVLL